MKDLQKHAAAYFPPARPVTTQGSDGSIRIRSAADLRPAVRSPSDWLAHWARHAPDRTFLAERPTKDSDWTRLSYCSALKEVRAAAAGLIRRNLGPSRPLMILSENSIEHALLSMGAMYAGIPVVPVSTAYSLMDSSFGKLRHITAKVRPGMVFAADPSRYGAALRAIGAETPNFDDLLESNDAVAEAANAKVTESTIAKILFTSGSTGVPKGVLNTHGMLTASQQQSNQVWPILYERPPVLVDWLPWNHTFGGNYNFNLVLSNGGTLHIDAGRPVPGLVQTTVANLTDIAPTMYCNVPRGFDLLLPLLQSDAALRKNFFSQCNFVFYAAAALPQNLWDGFLELGRSERGEDIALVSAWGATETAPLCTAVHFSVSEAGNIGLPVPGCELKLVPNAGKMEVRVKGPQVMPGYLDDAEQTAAAFDEEGFYRIGDALKFADPAKPESGFVFDGRVAEDFKLSTGTWVSVGTLRVQLIAAAEGLVQDAVITGHGHHEIGALLFPNPAKLEQMGADAYRAAISSALGRQAKEAGHGTSIRFARALILAEPPSIEAGEITDKGYINQRFVLERRKADVDALHTAIPGSGVILTPAT